MHALKVLHMDSLYYWLFLLNIAWDKAIIKLAIIYL